MYILILGTAIADPPCTAAAQQALGGERRWSRRAYTIHGTVEREGVRGTFEQHETPDRTRRVLRFEHGLVEEDDLRGVADLTRWLVDLGDLEAQPEPCRWQRGTSTLSLEGVLPARRAIPLCTGEQITVRSADWRELDGALFPYQQRVEREDGEVFATYTATQVTPGINEGAFPERTSQRPTALGMNRSVPISIHRQRPWVEVELTGPHGTERGRVLLDTGWSIPAIDRGVAARLGIEGRAERGSSVRDAAGREIERDVGVLPQLRLGDGVWHDVHVQIVDSPESALGVIGYRLFEGQAIQIRSSDRTLRWGRPTVPTEGHALSRCGGLHVDAEVGGQAGSFVVDSGAHRSVLMTPDAPTRDRVARALGGGESATLSVATGEAVAQLTGPVPIQIGEHLVHGAELAVMVSGGHPRDGLLGWDVLQCFDTTLDLEAGRARFDLVGDPRSCAALRPDPRSWGSILVDVVCFGACLGGGLVLPMWLGGVALANHRRRRRLYADALDEHP